MTMLDLYLVRHGQSYGQTSTLNDMPPDCETGLMEYDWRLTALLDLPALETVYWRFSQDNTGLSRVVFAEGEPRGCIA